MSGLRKMLLLALTAFVPALGRASEVKHIVVLPFNVAKGVDASTGKLLDDIVLNELSERAPKGVRVIGSSDVTAMLGIEQQKQMVNCDETSCMAEIGSALGATHIWVPSVGKLGSKFVISTKFMDVVDAQVILRKVIYVGANEDELLGGIRSMVDLLAKKLGWGAATSAPLAAQSSGDTQAQAKKPSTQNTVAPTDKQAQKNHAPDHDAQAGEPDEASISPLAIAGIATAGLGLAAAGGMGVWALVAADRFDDPDLSGGERLAARDTARLTGALSVASVGLVVVGAVVAALGFF